MEWQSPGIARTLWQTGNTSDLAADLPVGFQDDLGTIGNGTNVTFSGGNVIFDAPGKAAALERAIEASLENALRFPVGTFLRTPKELQEAVAASPFADETPGALYVGFGGRPFPAGAASRIKALETDAARFAVVGREVYWRGLNGMGQSKVTGAAVEKALGSPVTFRSISTIRKLAAKCDSAPGPPRRRAP